MVKHVWVSECGKAQKFGWLFSEDFTFPDAFCFLTPFDMPRLSVISTGSERCLGAR